MASTSSFDVTTGVDFMEVHNAVDQAMKEITQRYDFKGSKATIELDQKEKKIKLAGSDEFKLKAMWEVLQSKLVRRQVPLKNLTPGAVEPAGGGTARQEIAIQHGLTADMAREIVRVLKDAKLRKVQSAIQGTPVFLVEQFHSGFLVTTVDERRGALAVGAQGERRILRARPLGPQHPAAVRATLQQDRIAGGERLLIDPLHGSPGCRG